MNGLRWRTVVEDVPFGSHRHGEHRLPTPALAAAVDPWANDRLDVLNELRVLWHLRALTRMAWRRRRPPRSTRPSGRARTAAAAAGRRPPRAAARPGTTAAPASAPPTANPPRLRSRRGWS